MNEYTPALQSYTPEQHLAFAQERLAFARQKRDYASQKWETLLAHLTTRATRLADLQEHAVCPHLTFDERTALLDGLKAAAEELCFWAEAELTWSDNLRFWHQRIQEDAKSAQD